MNSTLVTSQQLLGRNASAWCSPCAECGVSWNMNGASSLSSYAKMLPSPYGGRKKNTWKEEKYVFSRNIKIFTRNICFSVFLELYRPFLENANVKMWIPLTITCCHRCHRPHLWPMTQTRMLRVNKAQLAFSVAVKCNVALWRLKSSTHT